MTARRLRVAALIAAGWSATVAGSAVALHYANLAHVRRRHLKEHR